MSGNAWMPFQISERFSLPSVELIMKQENCSREEAEEFLKHEESGVCYLNNFYQVVVYKCEPNESDASGMLWLSIKRVDKRHIHDWRDLQRIKNEIVGPENEAIEIYPAMSRLVDQANQYHLWVFADPTFRIPMGFKTRTVLDWDKAQEVGARQRPLPNWMKEKKDAKD